MTSRPKLYVESRDGHKEAAAFGLSLLDQLQQTLEAEERHRYFRLNIDLRADVFPQNERKCDGDSETALLGSTDSTSSLPKMITAVTVRVSSSDERGAQTNNATAGECLNDTGCNSPDQAPSQQQHYASLWHPLSSTSSSSSSSSSSASSSSSSSCRSRCEIIYNIPLAASPVSQLAQHYKEQQQLQRTVPPAGKNVGLSAVVIGMYLPSVPFLKLILLYFVIITFLSLFSLSFFPLACFFFFFLLYCPQRRPATASC